MTTNMLMSQSPAPTPQVTPPAANALVSSGQAPAQAPAAPPMQLPPPAPTKDQLQVAVKARQLAISNLTKTLNNPVLLANPDKLQKSLLSGAADIYRVTKDQGDPAPLIAHAMDIMKDPRGPKAALQDRLTQAISSLSDIDAYSRKAHGANFLAPSPSTAAPSPIDEAPGS